jgi:hypothetical protein
MCSGGWFFAQLANCKMQDALYLTDFPKRMRLEGKDWSFMYTDYLKSNRICRYHQLNMEINGVRGTMTPVVLMDMLREIVHYIVKDWKQDTSLFVLPPGSTYEGHKTYLEKFRQVRRNQQWLRDRGVNIPWLPLHKGETLCNPANCNRYSIVPKSFDKGRGIAPEPVARQVLGYQVDSGLRSCLLKIGIDLSTQEKNREWCKNAFVADLATVDLSAASDSISFYLVDQLLNGTELYSKLKDCRTDYINVNGQVVKNGRFCTMGNVITFSLETIIFTSVAVLALILTMADGVQHFIEDPMWFFNQVTVYGDDIIVPNSAYNTLVEICGKFGFTVNTDKSFNDLYFYRESCGIETILDPADNTVVSWMSQKYPRGTSKVGVAELVAMQHYFAENGYINADNFTRRTLVDLCPTMTQSEIGSIHQDIWCEYPVLTTGGHSPYGSIEHRWNISSVRVTDGKIGMKANRKEYEDLIVTSSNMTDFNQRKAEALHLYKSALESDPKGNRFSHLSETCHLMKLDKLPDDSDAYEYHLMVDTTPGVGKVPASIADEVEFLMYLLTLGRGIEHINNSEWTKPENRVHDRRDLIATRKPTIVIRKTL